MSTLLPNPVPRKKIWIVRKRIPKFESCNLGKAGLTTDKDPVSRILVGWNRQITNETNSRAPRSIIDHIVLIHRESHSVASATLVWIVQSTPSVSECGNGWESSLRACSSKNRKLPRVPSSLDTRKFPGGTSIKIDISKRSSNDAAFERSSLLFFFFFFFTITLI